MILGNELIEKIRNQLPFFQEEVFEKFFTWKDLEYLLNLRPFVSKNRIQIYNNSCYEWPTRDWLTDELSYPPNLLKNLISNYNCYLHDASRTNFTINKICEQLENCFDTSADAHIYFSLHNDKSKEFGIHLDYNNNLILQMEGRSKVQIWTGRQKKESPRNVSVLPTEPYLDVTLNPGSFVFIPELCYHNVVSLEPRLSISFPFSTHLNNSQERTWINIDDILNESRVK